MAEKVRVWDVPVRLFHWSLLGLFAFSWWSGENGAMDWHRRSGLAILALLLFRLFWGLAGSRTARFASFLKGPREVLAYARKAGDEHPTDGHNPLGGWSVAALLLVLLTLAGAGLFAVNADGREAGPLAGYLSHGAARAAAQLHEAAFKVALAVIGVHVSAIGFYQFLVGRDLIGPMITGRRDRAPGEAVDDIAWSPLRAVGGAAVVAAVVWVIAMV
ncbi:cytochrome b/b6 domain-containing protein [Novosphingobium jiangmenense]|uniref:Cytochrome b/b6 domain-containing protein n=1 Tax=Novosphingobium jiangmenense TaxID=2791981 RepID=A0ABS0HAS4_9SPHN|nr:cytochrome b/b6 domain-containing protein [Novosphingobium jiangmenense]MBF9149380.1 cytochrome b/b6 domain-containing protein [Novosphingobium jiangmenense]